MLQPEPSEERRGTKNQLSWFEAQLIRPSLGGRILFEEESIFEQKTFISSSFDYTIDDFCHFFIYRLY
jgi:hypothetical protein